MTGAEGEERTRIALRSLADSWSEMQSTESVLTAHALKAADALQPAAALRWCEGEPEGRGFVCLDGRLREAARKEGFSLVPILVG